VCIALHYIRQMGDILGFIPRTSHILVCTFVCIHPNRAICWDVSVAQPLPPGSAPGDVVDHNDLIISFLSSHLNARVNFDLLALFLRLS
jgi:hypothetical protein